MCTYIFASGIVFLRFARIVFKVQWDTYLCKTRKYIFSRFEIRRGTILRYKSFSPLLKMLFSKDSFLRNYQKPNKCGRVKQAYALMSLEGSKKFEKFKQQNNQFDKICDIVPEDCEMNKRIKYQDLKLMHIQRVSVFHRALLTVFFCNIHIQGKRLCYIYFLHY